MKIVIATPFYPPQQGVLATYAVGIEAALQREGHAAVVVRSPHALPPGIRHVVFFFKVVVAARGADAVLALDTWSVGMPAYFAARARSIPLVLRIGGDFLWESYIARTGESVRLSDFYTTPRHLSLKEKIIRHFLYTLLRDAHILFTTRFQRDLWKKVYTIPQERIRVVENFVPSTIPSHSPAMGLSLVSAGRDIGLKNIALLQRVVSRLANDHPGLTLDTRLLPPKEHHERIARSYAVIIPSLSEVCSNTAIDAVTLGKPFVMTEDTGTKERFADCGIFVDTRSEAALTQAIESLLDATTYERLVANAHANSFTHSWDDIAREIVASISKIV